MVKYLNKVAIVLLFFCGCANNKSLVNNQNLNLSKLIKRIQFSEEKALEKVDLILNNNIYTFDLVTI
jgi:hypothetical protein